MSHRFPHYPGERYGRLTILVDHDVYRNQRRMRCKCDCGNETIVRASQLRNGKTKSCGCLVTETIKETNLTHGHTAGGTASRTYNSWANMIARCNRTTGPDFAIYAGRGITVCERWQSFESFLADMGERPLGRSLDRIDNDGNYELGNCRWATPREQRLNQRPRALLAASRQAGQPAPEANQKQDFRNDGTPTA